MKLDIQKTIKLFDEIMPEYRGHISPVIGMIGEELMIGIFRHFFKSCGFKTELLKEIPKIGGITGPRLDAWIFCQKGNNKFWYQAEIKNWSAFAIGGYEININTKPAELKEWARKRMAQQKKEHFDNSQNQPNKVTKVLVKMRQTDEIKEKSRIIKPLLLFWLVISAKPPKVFSQYKFNKNVIRLIERRYKKSFSSAEIFSASLYLRELYKKGTRFIDIDMPIMKYRLDLTKSIFQ